MVFAAVTDLSADRMAEQHFVSSVKGLFSTDGGCVVTPMKNGSKPGSPIFRDGYAAVLFAPRQETVEMATPFSTSPRADEAASCTSPRQEVVEVLRALPSSSSTRHNSPARTTGTGVFLGGCYSHEELVAFGGVPESMGKEARSSARVQARNDEGTTIMERDQRRVADLNDLEPGTSSA